MDKAELGIARYRMEKLLKIKNDLMLPLQAIDKEKPQWGEYMALDEQLDKVIAAEARYLDAVSKA